MSREAVSSLVGFTARALVKMQAEDPDAANPDAAPDADADAVPMCDPIVSTWEDQSLRIASVFIILIASAIGVFLPLLVHRAMKSNNTPFFIAKYFGTGVILATAFMHLLSPAQEALGDPCLGNLLPEYDWANGIALMTVMVMLLVELMASRHDFNFATHNHGAESPNGAPLSNLNRRADHTTPATLEAGLAPFRDEDTHSAGTGATAGKLPHERDTPNNTSHRPSSASHDISYPPGGLDHLGHSRTHRDSAEQRFAAQLTALLILEFGVVFHSFFIGLVLSGTDDLKVLIIVLAFHQCFEGLGLGSRLATATWPSGSKVNANGSKKSVFKRVLSQRATPWYLAAAYALTTPLAIAIGLGVRESLATRPDAALLANGVFDAVSAGILLYVAIAELLAHEFMFSPEMRAAKTRVVLGAYACVALGAGLMAVLAKWA